MPAASVALVPDPVDRPNRWADLGIRTASALVLAPIVIACVWWGGAIFVGIVGLTAVGLAVEWLRLLGGGKPDRRACPAWVITGLGYIAIGATALLWLRSAPDVGRANVLFLLIVVWSNDIGAYVVGRLIGGPRMAPRISPGKTLSGAVGGLLAAAAAGMFAAHVLADGSLWRAIAVAAVLGAVAQSGDLLESCVKRRLEVKDSGDLIPGHGGLFDRLDALLAAAPVAAILALILGRGVVLWQ
jgi:phosphatidate cytidylyltransferase